MQRYVLAALGVLLGAAAPMARQQSEWKDLAPHAMRLVTVDENVQLEVLDWGGSGSTVVLLAGLGDTAHVFDDFAPALTARHRVLAVTRRGHGRSSTPPTGYGFARLAEDVMRVIDTVGVPRPIVIGHSFAGEEMHVLGARYPEKIAGLVYLDAAFNRGDDSDSAAFNAAARSLPPAPGPTPGDLASFATLRAFLVRVQGGAGPEAHLRARFIANPDGSVGRPWTPDLPVRQALFSEMTALTKAYNPEPIRVPALALYAVPKSAAAMIQPWYPSDDPDTLGRVGKLYQLTRERVTGHVNWFRKFAPQGRVSELSGDHYLFVSNPGEVVQHIEAFVSSLP
ncbi:MAG: alpha/beta fold hydrolase [Vicinamibacterales bacterium]